MTRCLYQCYQVKRRLSFDKEMEERASDEEMEVVEPQKKKRKKMENEEEVLEARSKLFSRDTLILNPSML